MRNLSLKICSVALALVSVGCTSTPDVPRTDRPAPAAWAMLPAPDLLSPLNGIISPSESESSL
ncbi:Rz1 family lipoprotein [Enterobacter hormaechei]|uniref:Rz1 family lipoprotein n=1 Tax=Enterobacter hormaechei TaxID=158836 RepID=UPI002614F46B|nr:Rz1 family lipoprotein [Enterobacter hormaechei]MDN4569112.1 Rz1 family lipoprotein [Enterobacter hormaechei]MDN4997133.1 Rz1 family lipoprotein [Enterobacter hormaechei]MED5635952.1 Rz1 family lipoprotein [Enterobacter hormaechei]